MKNCRSVRADVDHPALLGQAVVLPFNQQLRVQIHAFGKRQKRRENLRRHFVFPLLKIRSAIAGEGVLRRVFESDGGEHILRAEVAKGHDEFLEIPLK